jgi:ATP-dependent helicase/DNAse subunit B
MLNSEENIVDVDRGLVNSNYKSKTVNLYTTSTGKLYSSSFYKNMCISADDFNYLLDFAISQVSKAIDRILLGSIDPRPLKDGGWTACDYCDYVAICKFAGKEYNEVIDIPDMETLKNIGENNGGI